jgi:hypothetical protein
VISVDEEIEEAFSAPIRGWDFTWLGGALPRAWAFRG